MLTREEIANLVLAINAEAFGNSLRLQDEDFTQLKAILEAHPEVWPVGLADTFKLLQLKLHWQNIDRQAIPESLIDFFDEKFNRDLDPMALARQIGHEICTACEECSCRC
jgi:hypothetical protein